MESSGHSAQALDWRPRRPALEGLSGMARRAAAATALVGLLCAGLTIAVGTAGGASAMVPLGGRDFPRWLAGPLAGLGEPLTGAGFAALVGAMCVCYAVLVAYSRALPTRWAIAGVVALHGIFLLAPPLGNTDVGGYLAYARIGLEHGLNPYTHGAHAIPLDPIYHYAGVKWMPSPYGPLFTLATYPLAPLGLAAGVWLVKLGIAAAGLGCVALVWLCARRLGRPPLPAAVFVGLNPVLLIWAVGGAHNDVLVALLILAGTALLVVGRERLAAGAVVAAAAVKVTGAVLLPFAFLGARRRRSALAGAAAAGVAVVAVFVAAFGVAAPRGLLETVNLQNLFISQVSVPYYAGKLLGLGGVTPAVHLGRGVLLALALAWLLWRTWRGADWITAAGWATLAVLLTTTWLMQWYLPALLPLAALGQSRGLQVAALGLSAFIAVTRLSLVPF